MLLVPCAAGAGEEAEAPRTLPGWIPSIGPGFGIYSRDVKASAQGLIQKDRIGVENGQIVIVPKVENGFRTGQLTSAVYTCTRGSSAFPYLEVPPLQAGVCGPFQDSNTSALDGPGISANGQLLTPAWSTAWLAPRGFVQGGFAWPLQSRTLAASGFKDPPVRTGGEPGLRIQTKGDPNYFWWAGGGVAFQLPIESYTVRAKLGLAYMEESVDAVSRIDQFVGVDTEGEPVKKIVKGTQNLTIRSIAPSIGLEADLARFGPLVIGLAADTMFSIALSGTNASTAPEDCADQSLQFESFACLSSPGTQSQPGAPFVPSGNGAFGFKADTLHIFGSVSIRFSWVGTGR